MDTKLYEAFLEILKEELVPAMGCTEPVAVAYAGALARETLGMIPDSCILAVSGNIIKNVKSVVVPNTGGRRGLKTALSAGILFGNAEKRLEVIADIREDISAGLDAFMESADISVVKAESESPFVIDVTISKNGERAVVHIEDRHTNVTRIEHNGETVFTSDTTNPESTYCAERDMLNVGNIISFAQAVRIDDVKPLLDRQIKYNMEIAEIGLNGGFGAEIGKVLLSAYGDSVSNRAKAYAAAGSDARMNGCEKPVVINSGSGNQGITASVPVVVYAKELNVSKETLYRALVISNLITIHLKSGIGSLSAYCGATSAGAGAGAGICYLYGGGYDEIAHTVVNALAIDSGMICDGAKASCAAKIASAVEAGLLGFQMYSHDKQFYGGDGIVIKGVENTIKAVSRVAREGMRSTDEEIIKIMISSGC